MLRRYGFGLLLLVGVLGCEPRSETAGPSGSGAATPAGEGAAALQGTVKIDGSSTVYPISEAAGSAFLEKYPSVSVTVGKKGTGGGFSEFVKGNIDISDASRPIKLSELEEGNKNGIHFMELPIAYDGIALCVNKENDFISEISLEMIKKIYSAENPPKTWKEVDPAYPDEPIKLFIPGTDSGTYDFFKEVVVGKEGAIRSDVTPSEEDLVLVNGIASEKYGIGFFGASYYIENQDRLNALKVIHPKTGEAVAPTVENIEQSRYAPFGRPVFIYVNTASVKRPEVRKFVEYYLDHAADICRSAKCVPLSASLYQTVRQRFDDRVEGTYFYDEKGDSRVGELTEIYVESNLTKLP